MVMQDYNRRIIEEFRANEGRVGGPFAGAPMVLVTSMGAKSRRPHTTPLVYLREDDPAGGPGDRFYVFGSMGGAPKHPAWYHNLKTNPDATVEVGTEKYPVRAKILTGAERDRIFEKQASLRPQFAEYQSRTTRKIPVVALERVG
jgi:deazaflavin-dependent oxidoreductase (nitroreductase family)